MRKTFFGFCALLAVLLIWYRESRRFFCLNNGQCITVWKTYNNVCYIIPGKYCGIVKPSNGYIESANTNLITFYFSPELPGAFVFQSGMAVMIHKDARNKFYFYDFSKDTSRYLNIFYSPTAKKRSDMKPGTGLMDIDIRENYACDKDGENL
jgi:hypothetical protein